MTAQFDLIRKALKRARRLAYNYQRGGLQDLFQSTQDALVALDSLEKQGEASQLCLWQEGEAVQRLGGNNG